MARPDAIVYAIADSGIRRYLPIVDNVCGQPRWDRLSVADVLDASVWHLADDGIDVASRH
jgi:hypothetical protein